MPIQASHKKPNSEPEKIQSKGQRQTARIIIIARQVLVSLGYEAFAMRDIAVRAEMKLGNLQYYFPTKHALLEAVINEEAQKDLELILQSIKTEPTAEKKLSCFCTAIVSRWRGDSGKIFTLMTFLANENPTFSDIYKNVYLNFYRTLTEIIKEIDPNKTSRQYRQCAELISALIDGAPAQVIKTNTKQFVENVAQQALRIAKS